MPYFGVDDPFYYDGGFDMEKASSRTWEFTPYDEDIDSLDLRFVEDIDGQRYFGRPDWVLAQIDAKFSNLHKIDSSVAGGLSKNTYGFICGGKQYRIDEYLQHDPEGGIWTFEVHYDDDNTPD